MPRPKVSVIVPTYNVERYARLCFESLIKQTLEDIEIILVDDGSTDNSGRICDEYAKKDSRVKVIHQSNKGLGLSRNSGLDVAVGEYIGFVDSDDIVAKDMFEILYNNAVKAQADVSYCTYKKFISEDEIGLDEISTIELQEYSGAHSIHQYMLDRVGLPPQSKSDNLYGASVWCGIFSRKILEDSDVRFVSEREFISEDMIFDIDLIPRCTKIIHCNAPLYYYRFNPKSLTTVYKPNRFNKNVELYHEMYRRLGQYYSEKELFNSMSRYLLTVARIAIIQEARFLKSNGWTSSTLQIKKICKNRELQKILHTYDINQLPLKYRLICKLEKHVCPTWLLIITNCFYVLREKLEGN
jgi:glycosyltransferase involved in cell wall biosynthesis